MSIESLQELANITAKVFWLDASSSFKKHNYDIGIIPNIIMNNRLTSTAGRAFIERGYIDLSVFLMERNVEGFLDDTIPHELCHIIAWRLFNDKGHGKAWKNTVLFLGKDPTRCHSYITKSQAIKRSLI